MWILTTWITSHKWWLILIHHGTYMYIHLVFGRKLCSSFQVILLTMYDIHCSSKMYISLLGGKPSLIIAALVTIIQLSLRKFELCFFRLRYKTKLLPLSLHFMNIWTLLGKPLIWQILSLVLLGLPLVFFQFRIRHIPSNTVVIHNSKKILKTY
jgi:hypothetical protein